MEKEIEEMKKTIAALTARIAELEKTVQEHSDILE